MGTPSRQPERKYHGLLVLRQPGLAEPLHILSDINEVLHTNGTTYELASWHYESTDHPRGFEHLKEFDASSLTWHYQCGEARIARTVKLMADSNEVRVLYHIRGAAPGAELRLSPVFTLRGIHQLAYENPFLDGRAEGAGERIKFQFYREQPTVSSWCEPAADFVSSGYWNRRVKYPEESRRGYPDSEDLFCPGFFRVPLHGDDRVTFVIRLPGVKPDHADRCNDGPRFTEKPVQDFADSLRRAAEQFVYFEGGSRKPGIIAGYPWFGEWGRDTLIALPGLLLETGRTDLAVALLNRFAGCRRNGLIPNLLGDSAETSDWFSVDASLWFIRAVQDVHTREGKAVASRWFEVVMEILEALREGTPGVGIADNGLLAVDLRPRPGTWMDAQLDGVAVTPRAPFAVELNALFYNAVSYALRLASQGGQKAFVQKWQPAKEELEENFRKVFWLDGAGYLADSHDGRKADESLRPNQLIAASLPFKAISRDDVRSMLEHVRRHLRTPCGIRTLTPGHPLYRGHVTGTQAERDLAYHNGAVWPWLLGPYLDAVAYALGDDAAATEVAQVANDFRPHLEEACIGQISEIFDGDAPCTPRGAPAQAWSVSELLRLTCRYARQADDISKRTQALQSESAGASS